MAPDGAFPSAISVLFGSMFQANQCVNNPPGASGSSTTRTRLLAPEGVPSMRNGGLVSPPLQVNFGGIFPPSEKAELVIFILPPVAANNDIAMDKIATL